MNYTPNEVQMLINNILTWVWQLQLVIDWSVTNMNAVASKRIQDNEEKKKEELTKVAEEITPKKTVKK